MVIVVTILQILCVQLGGDILGLYPYGLTVKQWAICIGLSMIVWILGFLFKLIPKDMENDEGSKKFWPNKSYNLAVMTVTSRETLIDFEIDDDLCLKGNKK